eukprot:13979890-Alexandrium_andersonii.AAC.1
MRRGGRCGDIMLPASCAVGVRAVLSTVPVSTGHNVISAFRSPLNLPPSLACLPGDRGRPMDGAP